MLCVSILLQCLHHLADADLEFTIKPGNISTPLHLVPNVTFHCSVHGSDLRPHWIVVFPDINQNLSTRDNDDMMTLVERGVVFGSSSIIIPGVLENNCTLIRCAVFFFGTSMTEFSDPVKLTIVGEYTVINDRPILIIRLN